MCAWVCAHFCGGAFYSLIEVVEVIESDEGKVEPGQGEEAHAEEEEEPGTVALQTEGGRKQH